MRLICAISSNGVIGVDNKLPWKLPQDLLMFKALTYNNTMIMGRKTFQSFGEKALPNRHSIVMSRNGYLSPDDNVTVLDDFNKLKDIRNKNYWVIGGVGIIEKALYCNEIHEMYITHVHTFIKIDKNTSHFHVTQPEAYGYIPKLTGQSVVSSSLILSSKFEELSFDIVKYVID